MRSTFLLASAAAGMLLLSAPAFAAAEEEAAPEAPAAPMEVKCEDYGKQWPCSTTTNAAH